MFRSKKPVRYLAYLSTSLAPGRAPLIHRLINGNRVLLAHLVLFLRPTMAHSRDHHGITPLMRAAARGHNSLIKTLLFLRAETAARDQDGWSALSYASFANRRKTICLLIKAGDRVAKPDQKLMILTTMLER